MSIRKKSNTLALLATFGCLVGTSPAWALDLEGKYAPLTLKSNDDTSLRFIAWNQIWLRAIEQNPGTAVGGQAEDTSVDIGLRRIRLLALGQIGNDVTLMFHFGINNQTFRNNVFQGAGPAFYIHDAWTEYKLLKSSSFSLHLGGGLIYWNGLCHTHRRGCLLAGLPRLRGRRTHSNGL